MKELLKNRAVLMLLAALAASGVTALRNVGVPVECPPAPAASTQMPETPALVPPDAQ